MFGIAPSELMLLAVVALVVVGPKDLPRVMRTAGTWIARVRGLSRELKSGIDQVIRESDIAEAEKQWKADNDRIMREHATAPQTLLEANAITGPLNEPEPAPLSRS